jgi:glyoxylase-like metal-dependent hydrolase (beta-lactamase superfamily II)
MRVLRKALFTLAAFTLLSGPVAMGQDAAAVLEAASKAMGTASVTSIEYQGTGSSYNFGQAINVNSPWRYMILKKYVADIDYAKPAMREEMDRTLVDGSMPFAGFQQSQAISGSDAWNVTVTAPDGAPAPATVLERQLQIWLTPIGFLKAASAGHAAMKTQGANKVVAFMTADGHKIEGTIDARNLIVKTETWIDNPVLGDMPIVTTFANYAAFSGVKFPTRIVQTEGGYPVLELAVSAVKPNGAAAFDAPANVRGATLPPIEVKTQKIGEGVWFLVIGGYNSVLVEFKDYLVMIEAPMDDGHSIALMAEAARLVPGKPVKYAVNSHNHFDHLGGARGFAAEGVTIIAPAANVAYYQRVMLLPHAMNPDKLSLSGKRAVFEGVQTKRVLTDGMQRLELYVVPLKTHSDGMIVAYLPRDKILVEADAYIPMPLNAAPTAKPDPYFLPFTLDFYETVRKLKLDVGPIAPLHGRMSSWGEMTKMIGKPSQ